MGFRWHSPTRAQLGFADDDIVLASFNQLYKIEPAVFGAWLRVLKKAPRAKLWLLNFSQSFLERDLCKTAVSLLA